MQFQIEQLIVWPKQSGLSYKTIDFKKNSVNVITGDSRTGKSAIIPIIDYCLGSTECYIPTQTIRDSCSWFGIIVLLDGKRVLLARKEPGAQKSTGDMMIIEGNEITIPDIPRKNTTDKSVKQYLDETAKLSFMEMDEFSSTKRPGFRDLMAFCFQPQNVVANANVLFYRSDTTEHRDKLISIFPYVFNALTPEVLAARQELNDLERRLRRKKTELGKIQNLTSQWSNEIQAWTSVAIELGLLQEDKRDADSDIQLKALQNLVNNKTEYALISGERIIKQATNLSELRREEEQVALQITKCKNRLAEMESIAGNIQRYQKALTIQMERLNITEWLSEKARKQHICPVCQQPCNESDEREEYLNRLVGLRSQKKQLDEVPVSFQRELQEVKAEINRLTDDLRAIQRQIRIESTKTKNNPDISAPSRYTIDGISRILGKIEYATATIEAVQSDGELQAEIERLEMRIKVLKDIVDEKQIQRKIENAINKISAYQMEFIKQMDSERPNDPFRLDYKNLTVEVDGRDGRKDYLWEIGSGSNWLAYHVSTMLGLQMFFGTYESSVPGFIVFDQPSQVYFPHSNGNIQYERELKDVDKEAVKSIFKVMSNCIQRADKENDANMQIIVLEHADDSVYGKLDGVYEVCKWSDGEKLIPTEWLV